jgi:hypothetical protein
MRRVRATRERRGAHIESSRAFRASLAARGRIPAWRRASWGILTRATARQNGDKTANRIIPYSMRVLHARFCASVTLEMRWGFSGLVTL